MEKKNQPNMRLVFLLLVVILVSCSIDRALASPQELLPLTGWREKMIQSQPSRSKRTGGYGRRYGPGHGYYVPKPPPPVLSPLQSSPPSLAPSSMPLSTP